MLELPYGTEASEVALHCRAESNDSSRPSHGIKFRSDGVRCTLFKIERSASLARVERNEPAEQPLDLPCARIV